MMLWILPVLERLHGFSGKGKQINRAAGKKIRLSYPPRFRRRGMGGVMGEIEFLGCGPACDPAEPNTSFLFSAGERCMLFDCGFTVPHRLAAVMGGPDRVGGIWISHLHGDHFFGLPLLFLILSEAGRRRELVLAGPAGLADAVRVLLDMAYGSLAADCSFAWSTVEFAPGDVRTVAGMELAAAESVHSRGGLAVRCACGGGTVFYSGDGVPSAAAETTARGVDLAVMECFEATGRTPGHNNLAGITGFLERAAPRRCALVHVSDRARPLLVRMLADTVRDPRLFMPAGGDVVRIP